MAAPKKKKRGFGRDVLAAVVGVVAWELVVKPVVRGRSANPNGGAELEVDNGHAEHPHELAQADEMRYLDDRVRRIEREHERAWRDFGSR